MRNLALIDYDNLSNGQKSQGISQVARALLDIGPERLSATALNKLEMRIYGGWYEDNSLTPLAEQLIEELTREFPLMVRVPHSSAVTAYVKVDAQLAFALLEEPGHHLVGTFRKREKAGNVRVCSAGEVGCVDAACPLPLLRSTVSSGHCRKQDCSITPAKPIIWRNEQKIVDAMMSCDLLFAADMGYAQLLVVSEDDDFLPPLRTLLMRGVNVVRVCPKINGRRQPVHVRGSILAEYVL